MRRISTSPLNNIKKDGWAPSFFMLLLLMIIAEEIRDACGRFLQYLHAGQIDHAEMIRLLPVESASVDEQNSFVPQKIQSKLLIISNVEFLHIDLRENDKRQPSASRR